MDVAEQSGPGLTNGPAQVLTFFDGVHPTSSTFLAADATTMLTAMATDLLAQMTTTANLARIQAFASGGG